MASLPMVHLVRSRPRSRLAPDHRSRRLFSVLQRIGEQLATSPSIQSRNFSTAALAAGSGGLWGVIFAVINTIRCMRQLATPALLLAFIAGAAGTTNNVMYFARWERLSSAALISGIVLIFWETASRDNQLARLWIRKRPEGPRRL